MDESVSFEFSPEAIGHVLADRRLAVPVYQRSYSWGEEEVGDFWTDLHGAFREGTEYFIGNIVLSGEGTEGAYTIIDGQQRLATTQILLAAIRNEFMQRDDTRRANIIQDKYISSPDLETSEDVPKLRLNSDDAPFFRRLVVDGENPEEVRILQGSHQLIKGSLELMKERVREEADRAGNDWIIRLNGWTKFLEGKVRIVVVDVPTEADAFLIFETLNDRGADLTIADLLKNYLFSRSGEDLNTVRDGWMTALGALEMSAENSLFTTFIRHLWSSMHGATRERLLYKSIKQRITTRIHSVEFSQNLRESARLYSAILNSDHELWADLGTSTKQNVEALLRLDLEQMRPLLLALMQHFPADELRKTLRALVSWGVRGLVVGGIGGGRAERAYCESAVEIRGGRVKNVQEVLNILEPIVPTDEEFRASFSRVRVTKAKLARYYLAALERTRGGEAEPELVPNEDEEQVNLEHVLPRNPTASDWPQFSEEEQRAWVNRLGNMVLLQKGPNDRIGNKPWQNKKPILEASALLLTRGTSSEDDWTKDVINDRQTSLADLAVQTWPRQP